MPLLNEFETYAEVATGLSNSMFLGGAPEAKEQLPNGTCLFRFGRVAFRAEPCDWWMLFDDFTLSDRRVIFGFGRFLHQSGCRLDINGRFVPVNGITLGCADPGSRLLLVRLNTPVYAFLGSSTVQRPDPVEPGLAHRGGEFRVWIPGISTRMMNSLPLPRHFVVEPTAGNAVESAAQELAAAPEDAAGLDAGSGPELSSSE